MSFMAKNVSENWAVKDDTTRTNPFFFFFFFFTYYHICPEEIKSFENCAVYFFSLCLHWEHKASAGSTDAFLGP